MHSRLKGTIELGALLLVLGVGTSGLVAQEAADARSPVPSASFARSASAVPVGGLILLEDVEAADAGEPVALALERVELFTADARIVVHGEGGKEDVLPPPAHVYFRGRIEGRPSSRVFLSVREDGSSQGVVIDGTESYLIGGEPVAKATGAPLEMLRVDARALAGVDGAGFSCANDRIPSGGPGGGVEASRDLGAPEAQPALDPAALDALGLAAAPTYTARVAVETDFEFYAKFNNVTAAATYAANLLGYAATIYGAEINTGLTVQSVSLWTTSGDPWNQTSTACGLLEFGNYWNANRTNVSRTIAHFMSGKANGGGIAWVGVLCSGAFSTSQAQLGVSCPGLAASGNFGGGYGYTGNLTGLFNPNLPLVMWDIVAVSHEIGHNFNSPHTHCYANVGGNANPIDQCYSGECGNTGCSCASATLPGAVGVGSGTIMSYCHLLGGGFGNISLNFGTNHSFGVQPAREAQRMSSYVSSVAAANSSCLSNTLFANGFETGNTSLWQ